VYHEKVGLSKRLNMKAPGESKLPLEPFSILSSNEFLKIA
jgi:hypothetical protein